MPGEVTQLLSRLVGGDDSAVDRILPLVYQDLHALAASFLRNERAGHTLQPTALVNEAYLKLVDQKNTDWKDRTHFFAIASQAMRRVLVDHARARGRSKRGGGRVRAIIDADIVFADDPAEDILALDEALTRLGALDAQAARIVEMRCFAGLTVHQAAGILGVSERTVERRWRYASAWLHRELTGEGPAGKDGEHDRPP